MINTRIKNVQVLKNLLQKIGFEEIEAVEAELYNDEEIINCVDAIHVDEYSNESGVFTWFIPHHMDLDVEIDDTLVVEQVVGIGLAFVKAVSTVYPKTKATHEADLHPYCPVISNLGKRL